MRGTIGHGVSSDATGTRLSKVRGAGSGHELRRNTATGGSGPGFTLMGSAHELSGNRAVGNQRDGFVLGATGPASGVTISGATALRNLSTGIAIALTASGTTVTDSRAAGNSAWDFCGSAALSGNTFGTVCP